MCFVCPEWCDGVTILFYHLIIIIIFIKTYFHMKLLPYSRYKLISPFLNLFHPTRLNPLTALSQNKSWVRHWKSKCTWTNQIQMKLLPATTTTNRRKQKLLVILGATGAGKSRLSIDLSTCFFKNAEVINSDKIQLYSGLNITTNKMPIQERCGVPHHLLGVLDPTKQVLTPSGYRKLGSEIISDVKTRNGLPIIVGGSNSLIYSLVTKRFDPECNVFNGSDPDPVSLELRYDCCFIWVDVCLPVLNRYLSNRVDEMLDSGMFEELVEFFRTGEYKRVNRFGLGQAIGIPEFERYFTEFTGFRRPINGDDFEVVEGYNEAVRNIKDNTCQLAKAQVGKILRLRDAGWELNRVDATAAFSAVMAAGSGGGRVADVWKKEVVEPSVKIVKQFLEE